MPRVCDREGCGRRILEKNGSPSYDRHFCSSNCRREDKRERVAWYHGTTRRHPISPALSPQTTQTRASKPLWATNTALSTGLKRQ